LSRSKLYTELKRVISAVQGVKYVGLYNSQYIQPGKHDHPNYTAVYLQFTPSNFRDLGGSVNVQDYDCVVTVHTVFESYKIDAIEVLDMVEKIHVALSQFEPIKSDDDLTHFSKLLRIDERPDNDHDVLQIHQTDYKTKVRDYSADIRFQRTITITPTITSTFVDEITN
jgi:hypothetical protein